MDQLHNLCLFSGYLFINLGLLSQFSSPFLNIPSIGLSTFSYVFFLCFFLEVVSFKLISLSLVSNSFASISINRPKGTLIRTRIFYSYYTVSASYN